MKIWIDIENPPQVQYLLPVRAALLRAGIDVLVTARDYGATVAMLEAAGVPAPVFGRRPGRPALHKVAGLLQRAVELTRFLEQAGRPDALLCASRTAAIAARRLGLPSLIIGDYEFAHVGLYRLTGSTILHPRVIDAEAFRGRGIRPGQLVAFDGLKEDLTFAEVDLDAAEPAALGSPAPGAVHVLFRPPSETSHYYRQASSQMMVETLAWLADSPAVVVFSPRERDQLRHLEGLPWRHPPIVLERPVPFVSLLAAVDAVICGGGTMLREAAYLGVPAYTIFQSEIGGVDRWLEQIGRATVLAGPEDLDRITLAHRGPLNRLDSNPRLVDQLVDLIVARADRPVSASLRSGTASRPWLGTSSRARGG